MNKPTNGCVFSQLNQVQILSLQINIKLPELKASQGQNKISSLSIIAKPKLKRMSERTYSYLNVSALL